MWNLMKGAGIAVGWLLAGLLVFFVATLGFEGMYSLTDGNRQAAILTFYVMELVGQVALAGLLARKCSLSGILGRSLSQGLHVTVASMFLMTRPLDAQDYSLLAVGLLLGVLAALSGHWLAHLHRQHCR